MEGNQLFQELATRELELMADHVWRVDEKGPIKAICLYACDNPNLEVGAYWIAIRLGAQLCDFYVVGDCPTIRELDKQYGNVTHWTHTDEGLPEGNVVKLTREVLLKVGQARNQTSLVT